MGVLDLPAPLFAWLDEAVGRIAPATTRLVLWGVVGAVVSMALYRALSPQRRIAATRIKAAEARRALDAYDGDFGGAWPLIREMLGLSLRQVGLVITPAVVASLPLLCLIVWLSTAYGNAFPAPGVGVGVETDPPRFQARWVEAGAAQPAADRSPVPRIVAADAAGRPVLDMPLPVPVPVLHKRRWWNLLLGNPAGYLPGDGPVERVEIGLPGREYLPFGPSWLRGWEVVFFTALVACSVAIKVGLKIE